MDITDITCREQIPEYLEETCKGGMGLEVGVYRGDYLRLVADTWKSAERLYGIDCWMQQDPEAYVDSHNIPTPIQLRIYRNVLEKFKKYPNVTIYRMMSFEFRRIVHSTAELFNFVYLDANSSYTEMLEDLHRWWGVLEYGGLLAGNRLDQFVPESHDSIVRHALERFVRENNMNLNRTHRFGPDLSGWIIQRKPEDTE